MLYLYLIIAALVVLCIPYIRVICKRIQLLSKLEKLCKVSYSFRDMFLPTRFSRGFVIDDKYTVHIFTAYKRSEKIHLLPESWRVEKRLRIVGVITIGTQRWYTEYRSYPDYIKENADNKLLLFNPAPHSIYDGDKNKIFGLNEGDKILGMEIVTASKLIEKIIKKQESTTR